MIKNYIFDFGNVLGEFYPDRLTSRYVFDIDTRNLIKDIVFDRLYWDKLDMGTISDAEVKAGILSRLPETLGDVACKVYDNWINNLTPVKGMQELIYDIHKSGGKIYLLSNISVGFSENYKKVEWIKDLLSLFDGLVMSGTIRMAKPDIRIFKFILETFKLTAEECLFVDDRKENLDSAGALGINGFLFNGDSDRLRKYLGL